MKCRADRPSMAIFADTRTPPHTLPMPMDVNDIPFAVERAVEVNPALQRCQDRLMVTVDNVVIGWMGAEEPRRFRWEVSVFRDNFQRYYAPKQRTMPLAVGRVS